MTRTAFDPSKKTVYVLFENDGDHEVFYDKHSRINQLAFPFVYLKEAIEEAGYNFQPTFDYAGLSRKTDVAYILSLTLLNQTILESIAKHPREKCFFFNLEPITTHAVFYSDIMTQYFGKIFVLYDNLVDNRFFFKFYHPQCNEEVVHPAVPFEEKKLFVMIQANHFVDHPLSEYAERRKAAAFLSKTGEFDLYGKGWEGYSSWKGWTKTKTLDVLKNYKFSFVYENMSEQYGCLSSRLFDAIYAKSVPIYLGPKNINDYVPSNCFINLKDFPSYEELYQYLKNMDKETYNSYIDAAQAYIRSPKAEPFSTKQFARTIMTHIPKAT
ncbi:MAG: glycosyltransferase family 10 [Methylococcales bacterium]|nr:glycosyltransferase family 10 [Methylococcales bacterium]